MSASKIMIIRHAEKRLPDDGVEGVESSGAPNKHDLTVRGWQRAGALVRFFAQRPGHKCVDGIATPNALFAPGIVEENHGLRPQHTLVPLSELLNNKQPINTKFGLDDFAALVQAAEAVEGIALIAWEHKRIPMIAAQLPVVSGHIPKRWPGNRFDIVWVFDRVPGGWSFKQVPQLLLAGDDDRPIGPDEADAKNG